MFVTLSYVNLVLFLPILQGLEDDGLLFNVEYDVYDFLGVEVNTDNQSGKVTLTQ